MTLEAVATAKVIHSHLSLGSPVPQITLILQILIPTLIRSYERNPYKYTDSWRKALQLSSVVLQVWLSVLAKRAARNLCNSGLKSSRRGEASSV